MKSLAIYSLLIGFGAIIGWWSHAIILSPPKAEGTQTPGSTNNDHELIDRFIITGQINRTLDTHKNTEDTKRDQNTQQLLRQFSIYLELNEHQAALELMDEYPLAHNELKHRAETYLNKALNQSAFTPATTLIEGYLERYYDDIDILLILAKLHLLQGQPNESLKTHQFALTYAYSSEQQQQILQSLASLTQQTDQLYTQQNNTVALMGFYELMDSLSMSQPDHYFRQATIYHAAGNIDATQATLQKLESATTLNTKIKQQAKELLSKISQDNPANKAHTEAIPLRPEGNHFLVDLLINNDSNVTLLIDTGASITTLAHSRFKTLSSHYDFNHQRSQLFNTANGVIRGDIYLANTLLIGENLLENVEIAVLDYPTSNNVDGLLGMNILQHFHFEINQDKGLLHLRKR